MTPESAAPPDACDVVVIGAGFSGLCAAGLLSAAGLSVCVLEEQPQPGGYLQGFTRKDFNFDSAIHWLNGMGPNGLTARLLSALGDDWPACPRLDRYWRYKGESFDYLLTDRPDDLRDALAADYPAAKDGLERFFADCRKLGERLELMYRRMRSIETMNVFGLSVFGLKMLKWYLPVRKLLRAPMPEGLLDYAAEPGLAKVFCAEERLAAVAVPIAWAYQGDFFAPPAGGSRVLVDWMVDRVRALGSSVSLGTPVERVRLADGQASGVELADGQAVSARAVIAACDVDRLYNRMLPPEAVPQKLKSKLQQAEAYYSSLMLFCGLSCPAEDLGLGPEMIRLGLDDVDRPDHERGGPQRASLLVMAPSTRDASMVPEGCGSLTVQCPAWLADHDRWHTGPDLTRGQAYRDFKQQQADILLDRIDRQLVPGIRDKLALLEIATPVTFHRYTANAGGSIMGAKPSDENIKLRIAHNRTPVPGLFLAGHWAEYGGGVPMAAKAAANACLLALRGLDKTAYRQLRDLVDGR